MSKPSSSDPKETTFVPNTSSYRHRVKRFARLFQTYRLFVHGSSYVSRAQRDAIHYFMATNTVDADRRSRSPSRTPDTGNRAPQAPDTLSALGV